MRKIIYVPITHLTKTDPNLTADMERLIPQLWKAVGQGLDKLDMDFNETKVYVDHASEGHEADLLDHQVGHSRQILKKLASKGARLIGGEDEKMVDLYNEVEDMHRKANDQLESNPNHQNYNYLLTTYELEAEASRAMDKRFAAKINESLGEDETGILLINSDRHVHEYLYPDIQFAPIDESVMRLSRELDEHHPPIEVLIHNLRDAMDSLFPQGRGPERK